MKRMLATSAAAVLALVVAVPVFAGGDHCGARMSATSADAKVSCASKATAWTGAWLNRSTSGRMTVTEVAAGSPAARAGLKTGDVVLAVNGYDLSDNKDRALCASKADCNVGSAVTYTVQRAGATMAVKFKLEKLPANATARIASRKASFDPTFAAVVMPGTN